MECSVATNASSVSSSFVEAMAAQKHVLVCQNRTCLRQGAAAVLAAFQAHPVPDCVITKAGCMGQCGNGPMVHILPDNIWYCQVSASEVAAVAEHHLRGGHPVKAMLSPHFHVDRRRQP
jgi:(2Fe-2S) ferredoxin